MSSVPPRPVNYASLDDVRFGRLFWFIALFLIFSHAHVRAAQSVTLAWNASPSSGVTGYRVYYRLPPSTQNNLAASVGNNVLTATIPGLSDATTYMFWVTAYNSAEESSRSNEVSCETPSGYYLTVVNGTVTSGIPAAHKIHDFLIRYYHNC